MKLLTAPNRLKDYDCRSLFLAGSIDNGAAINWQPQIISALEETDFLIFNPRRSDWDPKEISDQVRWELDHILQATHVLFFFAKDSLAPISIGELYFLIGKNNIDKKIYVVIEDGFWRADNLIVTSAYANNITFFKTIEEVILCLKELN
jgi:hypothetical protein